MNKAERIAFALLRPINPSVIIVLGFYTFVWGLWIVNPFWTVFTQAALFSAMMSRAPEVVWGMAGVISGLLIMRGALKPSYRNLQLGAFIGFFHWLVIGIMYIIGDWMNTGGITALAFGIYSALIWLNIKVNRSHHE